MRVKEGGMCKGEGGMYVHVCMCTDTMQCKWVLLVELLTFILATASP